MNMIIGTRLWTGVCCPIGPFPAGNDPVVQQNPGNAVDEMAGQGPRSIPPIYLADPTRGTWTDMMTSRPCALVKAWGVFSGTKM